MTIQLKTEIARFETTKRLLSHLVNEGLCAAYFEAGSTEHLRWLVLTPASATDEVESMIKVQILCGSRTFSEGGQIISALRPHQLKAPVLLLDNGELHPELDPGSVFKFVYPWFTKPGIESMRDAIAAELQNAAANQETWLDIAAELPRLDLFSPAIVWEKTLVTGHPTHPLHKTLYTQPPLPEIEPAQIWDMISPEVTFLSLPRSQMRISGPFEALISDLLTKLNIPSVSEDRIIVPCLAQQQPSIASRFSDVEVVGSERASAQASMRTMTLRPELEFPYHLKLSLACQITSALRTITPWTALGGAEVSELLEKLLPPDMWLFKEVAAVTGAQADFNNAKHFSCILREDLELRANAQGESLIIASAFSQLPVSEFEHATAHAEALLPSADAKKQWFQSYVSLLLNLTLTPLVNHGIGLEAHGQNICVRICRKTRAIKGFAVRDFGGIRLHMPTLRSQGYDLHTIPPGAATMTDDLHDVWSKVHHSLFQNHIGYLIVALDLEDDGGWEIVRDELRETLLPEDRPRALHAVKLYDFLTAETMPFKCFLRMRMEGKYRDYVERRLPNVVRY
ncbi:ferric iron reductase FhuF-like transporter-domain-containing protein [Aspergillus pseudoustus]|uniref:Ferric iron reductase FhuF-like transporter-domain-containing protein n=1 Tax=Aspergillus pseudoustus TaxID=1810923 RepID=A0ABR4J0E0_9EURO